MTCKDCRYWEPKSDGYGICTRPNTWRQGVRFWRGHKACAKAEKRKEAETA